MPVLTDVQEEVESIAEERDLANDRAFSFWYLTEFREMSYELADPYVVDGPWDGGRDVEFEIDEELVKVDQDNNLLFVSGSIPGPNKNIVYISKV